ncbi:hypothetical protein T440DRAFT_160369 [Plenodomus tracheiphilus IPT5]|uniref:Uncharacterized protein n=1 Tax=Plenodomus tracheiphilus IPT5 TaxID=1408161 RepID=A0A6A7BJJ1_9PLEO|nr:hypothetical protein T440DRAFT_160369 [Plenodomus tracheiphilus IPT5]
MRPSLFRRRGWGGKIGWLGWEHIGGDGTPTVRPGWIRMRVALADSPIPRCRPCRLSGSAAGAVARRVEVEDWLIIHGRIHAWTWAGRPLGVCVCVCVCACVSRRRPGMAWHQTQPVIRYRSMPTAPRSCRHPSACSVDAGPFSKKAASALYARSNRGSVCGPACRWLQDAAGRCRTRAGLGELKRRLVEMLGVIRRGTTKVAHNIPATLCDHRHPRPRPSVFLPFFSCHHQPTSIPPPFTCPPPTCPVPPSPRCRLVPAVTGRRSQHLRHPPHRDSPSHCCV